MCCTSRDEKAGRDAQTARPSAKTSVCDDDSAKTFSEVQPNGLKRVSVGPDCSHEICKVNFAPNEEAEAAAATTGRKERPKLHRAWSRLASGHAAGSKGATQAMYVPPTRPGEQPAELHKELIDAELQIYNEFNKVLADGQEPDPVVAFVPTFRGTAEEDGNRYLVMGNLLYGFGHAKVMDVKIGVRTFLESEADAKKARGDLYKKFLKLYPDQLTDDERRAEAVTKFRYMSVHDEMSTSGQYGFRIDGAAGYAMRRGTDLREEVRKFSTLEESRGAFRSFATAEARGVIPQDVDEPPPQSSSPGGPRQACLSCVLEHAESSDSSPASKALATSRALLEQLRGMRAAFEASDFLTEHECLGTSILLVADDKGRGGAFWIDFAKTRVLPEGVSIDHRSPWEPGNHEDGVLYGLDRMVEVWESLVAELEATADEERKMRASQDSPSEGEDAAD